MSAATAVKASFRGFLAPLILGASVALAISPSNADAMHCFQGCSGGENCHAYSKCEEGFCWATIENKTCKGLWGHDVE